MDKDQALAELAREWAEKGVTGKLPTLWDLALALARAGATGGTEERDDSEKEPSDSAE